jgi:hypothetical protein
VKRCNAFMLFALTALTVLTWAVDTAVAAEGLGRLFFAPGQRAQLDVARAQRDRRAPVVVENMEQPAPQGPDVLTYSGVVRRNDGKSTVWINGKPMTERTRDSDVNLLGVRRDGAISVTVPQTDRAASLRVGQSLDITSGTIEEPYARRKTLNTSQARAATAPAATPRRPPRGDAKVSDPDSGAAPPVERSTGK